MRVGRTFTYAGTRYEPGDDFDMERLPAYQRPTFVRLYHLTEAKTKAKARKAKAAATETGANR